MAEKILAFAGSLRKGSFNKKLVRIAAQGARDAGAHVSEIDLADFAMPLYDGDMEREQGLPPNAKRFKQLLIDHQGVLISTPEYNTSLSAVLKNAIDWASRPEPGEAAYVAFRGKVGGLMSASPGNYGGVRSLAVLRAILAYLGMIVVPTQLALPRANAAFDGDDGLQDAKQGDATRSIGVEVVSFVRKLG